MNRLLRVLLFSLLGLIVIVALGVGGWELYRVATRSSLDAAGGTVLIYELDPEAYPDRQLPRAYQPADMAEALQRRLDPGRWLGITVQPVNDTRFEVSIPRSGDHAARVQQAKELIAQTGLLEFRVLANLPDDPAGVAAARRYLEGAQDGPADERAQRQAELERCAARGLPPPAPRDGEGRTTFPWSNAWGSGEAGYAWVELGRGERQSLNLHNAIRSDPQRNQRWQAAAQAREEGRVLVLQDLNETLLFSRRCRNVRLSADEQVHKEFEYFVLTREPPPGERITGQHLVRVESTVDRLEQPAVAFRFGEHGGGLFYALTSQNRPTKKADDRFYRHIAIVLDEQVVSAPRLNEAIRSDGQISGSFTRKEVDQMARVLQAGSLPAKVKPFPVSEVLIEPK